MPKKEIARMNWAELNAEEKRLLKGLANVQEKIDKLEIKLGRKPTRKS